MKKHRISRRVAGLAAAVTLSIGVASPVGLAQYEEVPDPGLQPAGVTAAKLKQCIKKAKKKFREDPVKKKQAIKKCKKKFG
jgi:flavin-dependent dehydrogenase